MGCPKLPRYRNIKGKKCTLRGTWDKPPISCGRSHQAKNNMQPLLHKTTNMSDCPVGKFNTSRFHFRIKLYVIICAVPSCPDMG